MELKKLALGTATLMLASVVITSTVLSGQGAFYKDFLAGAGEAWNTLNGRTNVVPSSVEAFESINGLKRLQVNDLAMIQVAGGGQGSKELRKDYLIDGVPVSFITDQKLLTTALIRPEAGAETYVSVSPNIKIGSVDELGNTGTKSKIDSSVRSKVKKGGTAKVIIEMDVPYKKFFETGETNTKIQDKKAKFEAVKQKVASLLENNISRDLQIINSISASVNEATLNKLENSPSVKSVKEDVEVFAFLDTSVDQISAKEAWFTFDPSNNLVTGTGTRIAIIDTGVDYTQPDLGGCLGVTCKVIGGYDYVNNDSNPMDDHGHGTHVAATAAGKGLLYGVAPDAKIVAYKVLSAGGAGYASAIIAAMQASADPNGDGNSSDHVDVASLSLGGSGNPDDDMAKAVDNASAAGVIFTIAGGNSGPGLSTIGSPGVAKSAITVAAACKPTQIGSLSYCVQPIASFSSRGPVTWSGTDYMKPDVSAPGVQICASRWQTSFLGSPTCFDEKHIRISGTSMATPHVAGLAALIKQANPTFSPAQVKDLLKKTAINLGGGLTYNDQGAGIVSASSAIPSNQKIRSDVRSWTIESDPTTKTNLLKKTVNLTSYTTDVKNPTVTIVMSAPGITLSASKTALSLSNLGSDTLDISIAVDNDVAVSGTYSGSIQFKENGLLQGIIPIYITVKPTFTISTTNIDYGVDIPSSSTWDSGVKQFTITNLRADMDQTVTLTKSAFASGISFEAPSTVLVPKGSSALVDTKFVVNNNYLANNTYSGTLKLSTPTNSASLGLNFVKFYVLTIEHPNASDINGQYVVAFIHNRSNFRVIITIDKASQNIYLNDPGTYDVMLTYLFAPSRNNYLVEVAKEGIEISATKPIALVQSRIADAIYTVKKSGTDGTGKELTGMQSRDNFYYYAPTGAGIYFSSHASGNVYILMADITSTISTNYVHTDSGSTGNNPNDSSWVYYSKAGVSSDQDFVFSPEMFVKTDLQIDLKTSGNMYPYLWACLSQNVCSTGGGLYLFPIIPVQTLYTASLPSTFTFFQDPGKDRIECPTTGTCDIYMRSPIFNPATKDRRSVMGSALLPKFTGNRIYTGLGPTVWLSRFRNSGGSLVLESSLGSQDLNSLFKRQDYALQEVPALTYKISRNNSVIKTGQIPSFALSAANQPVGSPYTFSITSGLTEFAVDVPYKIKDQSMTGSVSANFDTTKSDPNPPSITRLYYYANGARAEVYDNTKTAKVEMELNPEIGTIANVLVSYSADGSSFTQASVQNLSGVYTSVIPPGITAGTLTLRLIATDSSNNSLAYTFQVPQGVAPEGPGDPPPPAATTTPQTLTVSKSGTGGGIITSNPAGIDCGSICSFLFDANSQVSLSAVPQSGSTFAGWSGGCIGTINCNVSMTAPVSVTATFEPALPPPGPVTYPLSVNKSGPGTITSNPSGISCGSTCSAFYSSGTTVSLSATPDQGSEFSGWTGICSGLNSTCVVNVNATTSVKAAFKTVSTGGFQIKISIPQDQSIVGTKGSQKIQVNASDVSGIQLIKIYLDGNLNLSCASVDVCSSNWNLGKTKSGSHSIKAEAINKLGVATTTSISVIQK